MTRRSSDSYRSLRKASVVCHGSAVSACNHARVLKQNEATKREVLLNIPATLPSVVCVQHVTRGNKRHAYYARFRHEWGNLRKQYIRKAGVEAVREA